MSEGEDGSSASAVAAAVSAAAAGPSFSHTVVDHGLLAAAMSNEGTDDGSAPHHSPNFFVLHSATSLFAGIPGHSGRNDGEQPLTATFHTPADIVVDARQQLFVADAGNARIRRIAKNGGRVSTVASISGGDGPVENRPHGLAFSPDGTLYILQSGIHHHIFAISAEGRVQQLAGADIMGHKDSVGDLYKAQFNHPRATGVDSQGRLYICEKGNSAIRRVDIPNKIVETLLDAEGQPLDLLHPEGIVVDQFDDIYISDTGHHRIMKLSPREGPDGKIVNVATNYAGQYGQAGYENGETSVAKLNSPTGLAIDKQNHLWICDSGNNCIRMMSYRSELLFTISGRGNEQQERIYHNPTSIALSYDAMYGAEMASTTPDSVIETGPSHPLYYSYVTPVAFVADSEAHCVKRIHTILMEPANALIDVCNDADEGSYPLHNALQYADLTRRDELVAVLLKLKPHLAAARDGEGRLPIHVACVESSTHAAGSLSLEATVARLLDECASEPLGGLAVEDAAGTVPLGHALQQLSMHAHNESEAGMPPSTSSTPSAATLYSRELVALLLARAPALVAHPSCAGYTLHWMVFQGFGVEVLEQYVAGHAQAAKGQGKGVGAAAATSPFLVRDQHGRTALHVTCMMQGEALQAAPEVVAWLVEGGEKAAASSGATDPLRTRDTTATASSSLPGAPAISGHYPLYYACTSSVSPAPASSSSSDSPGEDDSAAIVAPPTSPGAVPLPEGMVRRAPLLDLAPEQVAIVKTLLRSWPEAVLENEGAILPSASSSASASSSSSSAMIPASVALSSGGRVVARGGLAHSFLEAVFLARAHRLLELFLAALPACLDQLAWADGDPARASAAPKAAQEVQVPRGMKLTKAAKAAREKAAAFRGENLLSLLHSAAALGDDVLTETLLRAGANPFQKDLRGSSLPVDLAMEPRVVALLRAYMERDARRPDPLADFEAIALRSVDTQTGPDSALEAARHKLQQKEEALKAEEERLAAQQRSLAEQVQLEQTRLREKEELLARETAQEREAARARADEALAQKTAELLATQARLVEDLEAEKARLRQREAEALAAFTEKSALGDAEVAAAQARLSAEFEAAKQAIAEREAAGLRRLGQEREVERARAESALEAERKALEQERTEKLAAIEAERLAALTRLERMESEHARAREAQAAESARLFQAQLDAEKAKLSTAYETRVAAQETQMAEEVHVARVALEAQKDAWEAELVAERAKLQRDFEASKQKLEAEEAARKEAARAEDAARRAAFEADKAERAAREERAREEFHKRSVLDREELKRLDQERAQQFALAESQRAARWEAEETERRADRAREQAQFLSEKARLGAEIDRARQKMEQEHAEKLAHEARVLEELRKSFEHDKAEHARLAEEHMARERARLRQSFDDELLAAQHRLDAQLRAAEEARELERVKDKARLDVERERLRLEAEVARTACEERLASERRRMEQDRARDAERMDAERAVLEEDRAYDARTHQAALAREQESNRRAMEAREATHRAALAEAEENARARLLEREETLQVAEAQRAHDAADRVRAVEDECARLRAELEAQIREKHAAQRLGHQRSLHISKLEQMLDSAEQARQSSPLVRVTANPLDVDPLMLGYGELPGVAENLAAFARNWSSLSFRSLLPLLLSFPRAHLPRALALLRMYFCTHPGAAKVVDEATGMLPLHLAAQAGLYKECVDVVLREHPLALRSEDRGGALAVFYAAAYRAGREWARHTAAKRNAEAGGAHLRPLDPYGHEPVDPVAGSMQPGVGFGLVGLAAPGAEEAYSLAQVRKEGMELVRHLLLKFPEAVYLPNRIAHAQNMAARAEEAARAAFEQIGGAGSAASLAAASHSPSSPSGAASSANANASSSPSSSPSSISAKKKQKQAKQKSGALVPAGKDGANAKPRSFGEEDPLSSSPSLSLVEYAIEEQDLDLLTLLLELTNGDFLNACDSAGAGYLHRAAGKGRLVLVRWLVEVAQVNPWVLCHADRTPLEFASARGHDAVAQYLTAAMAKGSGAPQHGTKARKGARRMITRGEDEEDGLGSASSYLGQAGAPGEGARFIGGRDALGSPVRALAFENLAQDPSALTPRATGTPLRPVRTARASIAGSPTAAAAAGAGHTTHIHVYGAGAGGDGPGSSPSHGSAKKKKPLHSYHWEFFHPQPKNATLTLVHGGLPLQATATRKQQQSQQLLHSPLAHSQSALQLRDFAPLDGGFTDGSSSSPAATIQSLQATTSNLHQLLHDLSSPTGANVASSPTRNGRAVYR